MQLRLQFSLRTLLMLAMVLGGVLAFVVMPWLHRQEQLAILARLRNDYGLSARPIEGKDTHYLQSFESYENLDDKLIQLINSCELISTVKLDLRTGPKTGNFKRLLQLKNISEIELDSEKLNEEQMQVLRQLPLKKLYIKSTDGKFQTWPFNRELEEFTYYGHDEEIGNLQLADHSNIKELRIQVYEVHNCPAVDIRNCPALETCFVILPKNSDTPDHKVSVQIEYLKNLEALILDFSRQAQLEIAVHELPNVKHLDLDGVRWNSIAESKNWQLRLLRYTHEHPLDEQELEAIYSYPNLESLTIAAPHPRREDFQIPRLPRVTYFVFGYQNEKYQSGELALQYLLQMPNLQNVHLSLDRISPELQKQILTYSELYSLGLWVKDDLPSLEFLKQFPKLFHLALACRKLTSEQIKLLGALPQINELRLFSTSNKITDFSSLKTHRARSISFNWSDIRKPTGIIPVNPGADLSNSESTVSSTP